MREAVDVSSLIDTAASLVAKMKTQAFAEGHELTQDNRHAAYAQIDQALERFMARVREFAPLLEAVDSYSQIRREIPSLEQAERLEGPIRKILEELERLSQPIRGPAPAAVTGFARAGDVQIPITPDPGP